MNEFIKELNSFIDKKQKLYNIAIDEAFALENQVGELEAYKKANLYISEYNTLNEFKNHLLNTKK